MSQKCGPVACLTTKQTVFEDLVSALQAYAQECAERCIIGIIIDESYVNTYIYTTCAIIAIVYTQNPLKFANGHFKSVISNPSRPPISPQAMAVPSWEQLAKQQGSASLGKQK